MIRKTFLAVALTVLAGQAYAIPIQLNETQFAAQIAGSVVVVEDFEGFATGDYPAPVTLANSTYTSNFPRILDDFILSTRQLVNNAPDPDTGRVFNGFAAGTTAFGLDIGGFADEDVLSITVVGGSGTLGVLQTIGSLGGFVGFYDALGISSVTFFNTGRLGGTAVANYAFDNVTTAVTSVPEPATLSLLGVGLLGLALIRRRRTA